MSLPDADRDVLGFAVDLATRAGALAAARFYEADFGVSVKQDSTEVTDADVAVEEMIRSELERQFPEDGFFGEETGAVAGRTGRRWIIDPIDGTTFFANRVPIFGLSIAYEDEYGSAIGVTYRPVARQMVYAGRGLGCRIRSGDVEVAPALRETATLGRARVELVNFDAWPAGLLVALHQRVRVGGYVFGVAAVLTGMIDAVVIAGKEMGYEDLAPLPVIFSEAGARATDLDGAPLLSGSRMALISTGQFHDELLDVISGAGPWDRGTTG